MAGVFVNLAFWLRLPLVLTAPTRFPCRWIVDGEIVEQVAVFFAAEPLGHMQVFVGTNQSVNAFEIFSLHHQHITIPIGNGVTHPLPVALSRVLGVDTDDSRVVHHFLQNHDVGIRLHHALIVVVQTGDVRHRCAKADQTPLTWRKAFRTVKGTFAVVG